MMQDETLRARYFKCAWFNCHVFFHQGMWARQKCGECYRCALKPDNHVASFLKIMVAVDKIS
jgi:hypothetical protein